MGTSETARNSDVMLKDIIDVLQNGVEESLSLKSKLPKLRDRFSDDVSTLLLDVFSYYRITCNNFENAILAKSSVHTFNKSLRKNRLLSKRIDVEMRKVFKDDKVHSILFEFWNFFKRRAISVLTKLVRTCYNNGDSKTYIVTGKTECLNLYLSFVSTKLGTRFIRSRNKFIFFVQPYYEQVPRIYDTLVNVCNDYLKEGDTIVLSYRFFDNRYTIPNIKINNLNYIEKLHKQKLNICIACKDFYDEFGDMDYLTFDDKMDEYTD